MSGPILVVGTGRSGTSTVARLLHEQLGVVMFRKQFLPPDEWGPKGYYEDRRMKEFVKKAIGGRLEPAEFARCARDHMTGGDDAIQWGFKITQMVHLSSEYLDALRPRRIIVCLRERSATAVSTAQWRHHAWKLREEDAFRKVDDRVAGLLKLLHGRQVLWLDFSERRDEDVLRGVLRRTLAYGTETADQRPIHIGAAG